MANSAFETTIVNATNQDCNNGEIIIDNLTGFAPYEFVWTFGNNNTAYSTDQSPTGLGAGQYCVTVTDALCGVASACFEIACQECFTNEIQTEVGADFVSFNIDDVTGIALPLNISIVETSTGLILDQEEVMGNGAFELSNLDFQIGEEYCIVYLDDNECTFSDCFTIEGNTCPGEIQISLSQITDASCGGNNGSIEVGILSACEQLEVYWDNDLSLTGPILSNAAPGQHCVYVRSTSAADCIDCFAVQCFDIYYDENEANIVCTTISFAAGSGCPVEDVEIETESCGETVTLSTGDNGEICVGVPTGECVELEIPNCEFGAECIDENDVVVLRKMILGIITDVANHPYVAFLGDANGNSYVSTLDLVYIMRFILDLPTNNSQVGECVLFTPESIVPGPAPISYSGTPNNQLCDGDVNPEMLLGVIGDGDGSCNCDLNGLVPQDDEIEVQITKNEKSHYLAFEETMEFYDCVITLSAPQLNSENAFKFTSINAEHAHLAVDKKGDDLIITMHSKKKTPITLKKGELFFILDDPNTIKLKTDSKFNYVINNKLTKRPIVDSRGTQKSVDRTEQLFTVAQKMLWLNEAEIDQSGKIRILAMDGRLLYQNDFAQYEAIDMSHWGHQVLIVQYLTGEDFYNQVIFNY